MTPEEKKKHDAEMWRLTLWTLSAIDALAILALVGIARFFALDLQATLLAGILYVLMWSVQTRAKR